MAPVFPRGHSFLLKSFEDFVPQDHVKLMCIPVSDLEMFVWSSMEMEEDCQETSEEASFTPNGWRAATTPNLEGGSFTFYHSQFRRMEKGKLKKLFDGAATGGWDFLWALWRPSFFYLVCIFWSRVKYTTLPSLYLFAC